MLLVYNLGPRDVVGRTERESRKGGGGGGGKGNAMAWQRASESERAALLSANAIHFWPQWRTIKKARSRRHTIVSVLAFKRP